MFKLIFVIFLAFHVSYGGISGAGDTQQRLVMPDVKEYRQNRINSDKHKFGYELEENQHFHHTTTEEDGVRLGCYGHVLEGVKHSTQYVADAKGYRTVSTSDLISVYPKSGGERKASFMRNFNEEEIMSKNIRFFFPDGCTKAYQTDLTGSQSSRYSTYVRGPAPTTTQPPFHTSTCTCLYFYMYILNILKKIK